MSRPADWSALDRAADPVPGDPHLVAQTGREYLGTADSILRAARNLDRALDSTFGQAESIDAIRDQGTDVAERILKAEERYRGVGEAMVAYAPLLERAQTQSAAALQKAIDARGDRDTAERMVDYYQDRIADPATPPANLAALHSSLGTWQDRAGTASGAGADSRAQLADAEADRDRAAASAMDSIRLVENSGGLNDSWWDNHIVQWVQEHNDMLDSIGYWLGAAAAVAGLVLLFVPGLNVIVAGILTAIVLTNIVFQAVNAAGQVASGTMSTGEAIVNVGLAVLNVVGLGATLKLAIPAMRATAATSLRASWAGSRLSGMTQARALTVVDEAIAAASKGPKLLNWSLAAIGYDARVTAPLEALSKFTLLSGAVPTGIRVPMLVGLGTTGGVSLVGTLTQNVWAGMIDDALPTPYWRVGVDW